MASEADRIIGLYQRHATDWDRERGRWLFEKTWLDRFLTLLPLNPSILDIGCGAGEPISRYFIEQGCHVTGIDSSSALIGMCQERFPDQDWIGASTAFWRWIASSTYARKTNAGCSLSSAGMPEREQP